MMITVCDICNKPTTIPLKPDGCICHLLAKKQTELVEAIEGIKNEIHTRKSFFDQVITIIKQTMK